MLVVKSQDLAAYAQLVAGFTAEVDAEVIAITLPENPEAAERLVAQAASAEPALVLALGPTAASLARRKLEQVPTVFAMVPYYEKYGLEGPHVAGIALTSDYSAELATLQAVYPEVKRVGVLHDPRVSGAAVDELKQAVSGKGLTLVPLPADGAARAEAQLKGLGKKVDAMLMIPDKTVSNAEIVRAQIRACKQDKLPLVAISASQVREGATFALAPSYLGLGQQAGRLANRIVHEKIDPGALAVARPEALDLSVNLSTVTTLGAAGPTSVELLRFAAQKSYSMRVYP